MSPEFTAVLLPRVGTLLEYCNSDFTHKTRFGIVTDILRKQYLVFWTPVSCSYSLYIVETYMYLCRATHMQDRQLRVVQW